MTTLGPKEGGRVVGRRYIKRAYNTAVKVAQLDDVTFHTLRHTFASWAEGLTADVETASGSTHGSAQERLRVKELVGKSLLSFLRDR